MTYRQPKSAQTRSSEARSAQTNHRNLKKRRRRNAAFLPFLISGIVILAVAVAVVLIIAGNNAGPGKGGPASGSSALSGEPGSSGQDRETPVTDHTASSAPDPSSETTAEESTEPVVTSSMTFASTGDILIHPSVLYAFETEDGHDFTGAFTYVAPYYSRPDLMIANLEVPLVDPADGYEYSSNPFASPDAVAEALKGAGVDICLTANNHTYDMGGYGLIRTQNVLSSLGIEYTGTRKDTGDSYILTKTVNDIKLGMICYTYETGGGPGYEKSLNYIPLDDEDAQLVNTFDYDYLEDFYEDASSQLAKMQTEGCDVSVFYLHWGDEYLDEPNGYQEEIAQRLCDLGVDIIIGGHPHVIQRYELLNSAAGHQTVCLYSMGNELSNQRREYMNEDDYRGYTEDGIIFEVTLDKYSNGEVKIGSVDVIPTWVQRDDSFEIIPLDPALDAEAWPADDTDMAVESYERTMGRLGDISW